MLQLNTTVCTISTRCISRFFWRLNASLSTNPVPVSSDSSDSAKLKHQIKATTSGNEEENKLHTLFCKLKSELCSDSKLNDIIISKFEKAKDVEEILKVMEMSEVPQNEILKAFEIVTAWMNENKHVSSSLYNRIINKSIKEKKEIEQSGTEINNMENDMSKYENLATNEMVLEISKLARKRNRNTKILHYFFENILNYNEILTPGACSNLMYSLSILYYSDERLLKKICEDFMQCNNVANMKKLAITTSMVKSMSVMRYKHETFLNYVCNSIIKSKTIPYSNTQIVNILMSFALLGYRPKCIYQIKELLPKFTLENIGYSKWLDLIWSLAVLNSLEESDITFVLNQNFISKLMDKDSNLKLSHELKLLNINAYAQYALKNYSGPLLDEKKIVTYAVNKRSKQKNVYVEILKETLKGITPSTSHFKMNVNTKMGFLIDAELHMTSNLQYLAVSDDNSRNTQFTKVAIMVLDYYDMCLGSVDYQGLIKLYKHLLTCKGYIVLPIPYQYFGVEDKPNRRMNYLKTELFKKVNFK